MVDETDRISLDLGEYWAMARWKDSLCIAVTSFDGGKFTDYAWENTKYLLDKIEKYIQTYRVDIVLEKAHHRVPTQWVQYQDVKKLCKKYNIILIEYKPSHIKKMVTGNGRASKDEVKEVVVKSEAVKVTPTNEHESDAIACGLCYLENQNETQRT